MIEFSAQPLLSSLPDILRQTMELRLAEVDALPEGVQTWMAFMRNTFLASILFAWWRKEARVVLAMALITALSIITVKSFMPEVHSGDIGRIVHIVVWTPVLIYLANRWRARLGDFASRKPFAILFSLWTLLVMGILTASLFMDVGTAIKQLLA